MIRKVPSFGRSARTERKSGWKWSHPIASCHRGLRAPAPLKPLRRRRRPRVEVDVTGVYGGSVEAPAISVPVVLRGRHRVYGRRLR